LAEICTLEFLIIILYLIRFSKYEIRFNISYIYIQSNIKFAIGVQLKVIKSIRILIRKVYI